MMARLLLPILILSSLALPSEGFASGPKDCNEVISGTSLENKFSDVCSAAKEGFGDCLSESSRIYSLEDRVRTCAQARSGFSPCFAYAKTLRSAKDSVELCLAAGSGFKGCKEVLAALVSTSQTIEHCLKARSGFASCFKVTENQSSASQLEKIKQCLPAKSDSFGPCYELAQRYLPASEALETCLPARKFMKTCFENISQVSATGLNSIKTQVKACLALNSDDEE